MNDLFDIGVGIDLVEINRFKELPYSTNQSFHTKIFSEEEIDYCLKFNDSYRHFAGKFALKEALIKSIKKKIQLSDIFTSHLNSKPQIDIKKNCGEYDFHASLSHETNFAIAVVLSRKLV
jgi:holo-[acyl-carrier protein] synthase